MDDNFVRGALPRGLRFGFIGSSDGHGGHPGLVHLVGGSGGLTAIVDAEPSRELVAEALRTRSVYATNGPRILPRVVYGGWRMGATVPVSDGVASQLVFEDLVPGVPPAASALRLSVGNLECSQVDEVADVQAGGRLRVRVLLADGEAAWSSPFYLVDGRMDAVDG